MNTNHANGYHDPVRAHSVQRVNELIDARIEENISTYRQASPWDVNDRLNQLEHEWDVERLTMANLGGLAAVGGLLGLLWGRRWFWLSALAGGFIVQQTLRGWSPPASFARRFRVRTREEIDREYDALCDALAEQGRARPSGTGPQL